MPSGISSGSSPAVSQTGDEWEVIRRPHNESGINIKLSTSNSKKRLSLYDSRFFCCFPYRCNALPIKKREEEKGKGEETKKHRENVRSVWIFSLI